MKNLKKGFTLIELLVVIAIIGILATTLAPKLRVQLAKAKDSKATSLLGVVRTAGSVALIEALISTTRTTTNLEFDEILGKIDKASREMIAADGSISIGGSKNAEGDQTYGGSVGLVDSVGLAATDMTPLKAGSTMLVRDDEISIFLRANNSEARSSEGKNWSEY
ncbi:MAG: type II secretion system protein [Psychrilyobacter sp.]|nr:type II secretion system protein [Psychrilyobacter sp.]